MPKKVLKIVVVVLLVLMLLLAGAVIWIDRIAKTAVEAGAGYALGVPTKLGGVHIGLIAGNAELSGLKVSNPSGFQTDHFLNLDSGSVEVTLGSLRQDVVVIPKLELGGISVNLEKDKSGKANYQVILDNLKKLEGSGEAQKQPGGEGKKFVIKELVISDVKVHADVLPVGGILKPITVKVDRLELHDVGSAGNNGKAMAEVTDTILKAILLSALENGKGILPDDITGELGKGLAGLQSLASDGIKVAGELGEKIGQIGTEVGKELEKASGEIEKNLKEVGKGIGDLFKSED